MRISRRLLQAMQAECERLLNFTVANIRKGGHNATYGRAFNNVTVGHGAGNNTGNVLANWTTTAR